jgi:hypothetical protein
VAVDVAPDVVHGVEESGGREGRATASSVLNQVAYLC